MLRLQYVKRAGNQGISVAGYPIVAFWLVCCWCPLSDLMRSESVRGPHLGPRPSVRFRSRAAASPKAGTNDGRGAYRPYPVLHGIGWDDIDPHSEQ